MKKIIFPIIFLFFTGLLFFRPLFLENKLPIPSDTIIGMYFPYRDLYAKEYPRGLPFKNFQITDPVRQQYPWKNLVIDNYKHFQLPLWNPYNFSGTPLLANFQSAAFYPLNILFFVMPFANAWSVFILLQPLLAMVFMYLYLRNLALSKSSSLLGAVSFGFCGFFVSWMEWSNVVSTALWLPLVLLFVDKLFIEKKKIKWDIFYILAIACAFLAGHLQVFFYLYVITIFYFLIRWLFAKRHKYIFFHFLLSNILFICLTIPQWIPTLQFIGESARNLDQDWHNPGWFIPYQNLTQFIAPDFFGNPSTLNYWGVWNYGEFIGYIGMLPLLFALHGILFSKRKIVWFFSFIVFFSLLLALPTIFAKIPFKFEFPFLSTSQPTRLIFLTDFALCVLAAYGLEFFLQTKKKIYVPLLFIGGIILMLWGFVFFNQNLPEVLQTNQENLAVTTNNLKLPSLLYLVSLLIFIFFFFERKVINARPVFIVLILFITIADLYRFSAKYLTFAEEKYLFPDTKILAFLKNQPDQFRVISNDSRVFPPNFSIMYKIQTPDGYDPLYLRRYAEFSAAVARNNPNIDTPFGFNRIITIQGSYNEMFNLLNIKYIIALGEIHDPHVEKVLQEGETSLYENKNVLPRAYFVDRTVFADGKQDAINKLFDNKKSLESIAVVEGANFETKRWSSHVLSSVKIKKYEENKIVLQTQNSEEGFLVLTDVFYPTWHAKICTEAEQNCYETKIYLTNYTFRGIVVPEGNHSIIFYNSLL